MMTQPSLIHSGHPLFSVENLYEAYKQCRRRKRATNNAMLFEQHLEDNLFALHEVLNGYSYQPEPSVVFMVEKPKRREIFAASFRDRVVHHLLVRHLEPFWERRFIHDSFACRSGKGTHKGVEQLQRFTRKVTSNQVRPAWYLQLDIQGFFMAINRQILFQRLKAKEQDPAVLWLLRTLVYHDPVLHCRFRMAKREDFMALPKHKTLFMADQGCGLPIGNLTSQFFANVYLDALDQFVKHDLKVRHYVRYCDDFVLLSEHRAQLQDWHGAIQKFLWEKLRLLLNQKQKLRPVADGIDFLGYIVRPDYLLVRRRVIGNFYERLEKAEAALIGQGMGTRDSGRVVFPWDWPLIKKVQSWLLSYQAHFRYAASQRLWDATLHRFQWWLQEYFSWNGRKPSPRYLAPRNARSFAFQKMWFIHRLPGHILLFQVGSFWVVLATDPALLPVPLWFNKHFPDRVIHHISQRLWNLPHPVAWIHETGTRTTVVADRALVSRWATAPHLISSKKESRHVSKK